MTRTLGYSRPLEIGEATRSDATALRAAGAGRVFVDEGAQPKGEQPELSRCLSTLTTGDTLVVTRGARLRPTLTLFVRTVAELTARGVVFRSLAEPALSTLTTAVDPSEVVAALESLRRELVSHRTRGGMSRAAAEGRRPGRPSVMSPERLAVAQELRRQKRSIAHIASVIGVSASAVQRALATPTGPR